MPFNGSNVYTPPAADFPVVTQTVISSTHFNNTINDIASALSDCVTRDGQGPLTANMQGGGFRVTNIGITAFNGAVGTPSINVGDGATGLYRSALNELAVSVNGVQRGRFDATGLIVTGLVTLTTTLTAPTSVVTPLLITSGAATLNIGTGNFGASWLIRDSDGRLFPTQDNTIGLGAGGARIAFITTPVVDSGSTGSLSLRTNNGTVGFQVAHATGTVVNNLQASGSITGASVVLQAVGTDTNIPLLISSKGSGAINLGTSAVQLQILDTPSAANVITVTGSAAGNPTIATTAGNLAITPSVFITGAGGTTPTLSVGASAASGAANTAIAIPNGKLILAKSAGAGNVLLIGAQTINSVNDIVTVGDTNAGAIFCARLKSGAPTTSDIPASQFTVWRDTTGATTKLYYNNAGALQSVALA